MSLWYQKVSRHDACARRQIKIVIKQLFTNPKVSLSINKDTRFSIKCSFACFTAWLTRVVYPASSIPTVLGINNAPIFQGKIKGVIGVLRDVWVAFFRQFPTNAPPFLYSIITRPFLMGLATKHLYRELVRI